MKKVKLEEIVDFIIPMPIRRSEEESKYKAVFPGGIEGDRIVSYEYVDFFIGRREERAVSEKYLLKKNDILFQIKGSKFASVLVEEELKNTIASNAYMILRIKNQNVNPKFLQWLLKTKIVMDYLNRNTSGEIIKIIRRATLGDIILEIPNIQEQEELAELVDSFEKEKEEISKYLLKKENLIERIIVEKAHFMGGGELKFDVKP